MNDSGARESTERVFTPALAVFTATVAAILAFAGFQRWSPLDLETAVRELADGDLDAPDRPRALRAVVDAGVASADARAGWAGLFAAIALDDRAAFQRARENLGPPPAERAFLDLGDPVLANLGAAMWAEAAGQSDEARRRWLQVKAQCRLAPRPLADELARAALK